MSSRKVLAVPKDIQGRLRGLLGAGTLEGALASAVASIESPQPLCPHCQSDNITHWGAAHGFPRYRCGNCGRTFNILTKTPLARLRNKERASANTIPACSRILRRSQTSGSDSREASLPDMPSFIPRPGPRTYLGKSPKPVCGSGFSRLRVSRYRPIVSDALPWLFRPSSRPNVRPPKDWTASNAIPLCRG